MTTIVLILVAALVLLVAHEFWRWWKRRKRRRRIAVAHQPKPSQFPRPRMQEIGLPPCDDDGEYEDDDAACTHCGGEGTCEQGCDPGWYDDIHPCHACSGTGNRRDQVIW